MSPGVGEVPQPSSARISLNRGNALVVASLALLAIAVLTRSMSNKMALAKALGERPRVAEDVLLSSFPKTGSFWLRFLLAAVMQGEGGGGGGGVGDGEVGRRGYIINPLVFT